MKALIDAGGDAHLKNFSEGRSILHLAALNGRTAAAKELVQAAANPARFGQTSGTQLARSRHPLLMERSW